MKIKQPSNHLAFILALIVFSLLTGGHTASAQQVISYVDTSLEGSQKFVLRVDDKPFYMTNIQIRLDKLRYHWQWNAADREAIIAQAAADGFNTVSIPIQWVEVESEKDKFRFGILDEYLGLCKKYGLRMELLWFSVNACGSVQWLGSKPDNRFRTPEYVLYSPSPDSQETTSDYKKQSPYVLELSDERLKERDAYALGKVMAHIAQWDKKNGNPHTVIGVQVGNEMEGHDDKVTIDYLNALAKAVKQSPYIVWTRVNCTYWSRHGRLDANEKLRASEQGTYIDFVGYDTYKHHFKTNDVEDLDKYKESMRDYLKYAGKNYRMAMEVGADCPAVAQLQLAALSGDMAFDYYDICGPDGHGLYERDGRTYKERSYISEVRTVNKLINSAMYDIALNANAKGLFVHNPQSNRIKTDYSNVGIGYTPVNAISQGISILRSQNEVVLLSTCGGTFTIPAAFNVISASRGYFDDTNNWRKEGEASFRKPQKGKDTSIEIEAGTTLLLTCDNTGIGEKATPPNVNNPILPGYYADPEVLYSHKTGKYYIYPTSDGHHDWDGHYFKVFSSVNLKEWKDEGVILDFPKDLTWAKRNAWAPCIIERKMPDGKYKYFYYYSAAKKIGVAVADHPTGPFVDPLGKALIDYKLEGQVGGQQIDPDVFCDPETGKYYLYWGCGYLAVAELNDDMVSIKRETAKRITPPKFTEGTEVLYRKGLYYFLWSEGDTRSEDYRVRYATAKSPAGPLEIPDDNLILAKVPEKGIYGTGHNCVLQVPGKDEWYIIYHRFRRPNSINMGWAAGYHREVCMDKMEFNSDRSIKKVVPTL